MKNTDTPSLNEKTNDRPQRDRTYWRSFEDLHDTPEFNKALQTEFMSSPLRAEAAVEGENDKWARREFLKLMGASVALTTAAGCIRRPVQKNCSLRKTAGRSYFGCFQLVHIFVL